MGNKHQGILQIKKTISTRTLLFTGIFVLCNVLCLFQLVRFSTGALLVTGILLLIGIFIRYEELAIYLFICLAFFNVMNANVQSTSLFYLLCGIVVVRYLFQEQERHYFAQKLVLICVIFLVTAYNLLYPLRYVRWFILLLTCILLYGEGIVTGRIVDIITLFSLAQIIASIWGYVMLKNGMAINTNADKFFSGNYSYLRFAGLIGDSVLYGGFLVVLIALNLSLLLANKSNPWLRILLVTAMAIMGSLTYSKMFYGGLVIEMVLIIWFWLYREKGSVKAFFATTVAVAAIAIGCSLWLVNGTGEAASIMRERMSSDDLSTGRLTAWAYYINRWMSDWTIIFKGIGFVEYATRRKFAGYSHSVMYAHNILVESVTAFGFLETVAILLGMTFALKKFLRQRVGLYWLIPAFMLFVVFGMISHGNFESDYYFFVLLVVTIPGVDARETICKQLQIDNNEKGEYENEKKDCSCRSRLCRHGYGGSSGSE